MNYVEIIFAMTTGIIAGAVFALVDAPIPAPPALAGVMGIFGIYLGYKVIEYLELIGLVANAMPF